MVQCYIDGAWARAWLQKKQVLARVASSLASAGRIATAPHLAALLSAADSDRGAGAKPMLRVRRSASAPALFMGLPSNNCNARLRSS